MFLVISPRNFSADVPDLLSNIFRNFPNTSYQEVVKKNSRNFSIRIFWEIYLKISRQKFIRLSHQESRTFDHFLSRNYCRNIPRNSCRTFSRHSSKIPPDINPEIFPVTYPRNFLADFPDFLSNTFSYFLNICQENYDQFFQNLQKFTRLNLSIFSGIFEIFLSRILLVISVKISPVFS